MRTWDKVKNFFRHARFFFHTNAKVPARTAFFACVAFACVLFFNGQAPDAAAQNAAAQNAAPNALPLRLEISYYHLNSGPATNGQSAAAVLAIEPLNGYYTYSHHEQGFGYPTSLTLLDAAGNAPLNAAIIYPPGALKEDPLMPGEKSYIYDAATPLFLRLDAPLLDRGLRLSVDLLLCSPDNCMPVKQDISLRLDATDIPALPALESSPWAEPFSAEIAALADALPESVGSGNNTGTVAQNAASSITKPPAVDLAATAPAWNFTPVFPLAEFEVSGLLKALLLGFLAGLILNVMPCVLPVISLKLSSLIFTSGDTDPAARRRQFRQHNLFFSLGIIAWFLALAVILGGLGLIWGQLFQSAWVIFGLLAVVFLLGLSMFDVFTLPVLDLKAAVPTKNAAPRPAPHDGGGRAQPFLSGIFVTLLATPCSGPLLGGVLGWAFQQGPERMALTFAAVGVGMASPYLLLAARPGLVRFLPRPGNWMLTLERIVGFFLMGTAIYLFSLLPAAWQMPTLVTLLAGALAAWLWGRFAPLTATPRRRLAVGCIAVILTLGTALLAFHEPDHEFAWEPFDQAEFAALLGTRPLMLEFTADWCPSCKLLEYTTLSRERLSSLAARHNMLAIRVDLTRHDEAATALLHALSGQSIPFAALFPAGDKSQSPLILRDLFTFEQLASAADQAFGK